MIIFHEETKVSFCAMSEKSVLKQNKLQTLEEQEELKKKLTKEFVYRYLYRRNKLIESEDEHNVYLKIKTIEKYIPAFNELRRINLLSDSIVSCLINHFFWKYEYGGNLKSTKHDFDSIRKE